MTLTTPLFEAFAAEFLWWDKCEVLGKIKDCSRMIQFVESEIEGYQDSIKESKEALKGQQALLALYSSQLADIYGEELASSIEDKILALMASMPVDDAADWRNAATRDLLGGLKGCGPRKLGAICEIAPTVGLVR